MGFTGLPFSKSTFPNGLTSVIPALGTCYFLFKLQVMARPAVRCGTYHNVD